MNANAEEAQLKNFKTLLCAMVALFGLYLAENSTFAQPVPLDPWLSTTLNGSLNLNDVTFGNGRFVAVGKGIYTSTDGAHWMTCVGDMGYSNLQAVVCNGNGFVAVGLDDVYLQPLVWTSADGTNWVSRDVSNLYLGVGTGLKSVAFGKGIYVATVTGLGGADTNTFAISTNGVDWSLRPVGGGFYGGSGNYNHTLAFGNGLFVFSVGGIYTSTDGITWSGQASEGYGVSVVTYGGGRFLAVGDHAQATSLDGTNWTTRIPASYPHPEYARGVSYGDGFYVAVTFGGLPHYSANGLDWHAQTPFTINSGGLAVAFGNGVFVSVGNSVWDGQAYDTTIYRTMSAMHLNLQKDIAANLILTGLVPGTCRIESKRSLNDTNVWSTLVTIPFTNSPVIWTDWSSTNFPICFYRAIWIP